MKDSEDVLRSNPSLQAAWDNLQVALEIWEGEVWRSEKVTAAWALNTTTQAKRLLERGVLRLGL